MQHAAALALLPLLLMPVTYRAGAVYPHGHALIQLIIETQAGTTVHHHGVDRLQDDHGADVATAQAGAPTIQITAFHALLPLALLAMALQTLRSTTRLVSDTRPASRSLPPGHPPPQPEPCLTASP